MWNIEYKGTLKGSIDTIASDKELPSSAVQFKEPSTTWEAFTIGSFILLPVILIMVGISWLTMKDVYAGINNCIRQVPSNAKVFNHGYHTYWILDK